jgi:hypothetical protein
MLLFGLAALAAFADAAPQNVGPGGLNGRGSTMLRFGCSQVVIDRIDPLVNPGAAPSPHLHQVVGGNAFNVSMPSTDIAELATCTTCNYADDFSNYWTANLYFRARNGSFKRVPQVPNRLVPRGINISPAIIGHHRSLTQVPGCFSMIDSQPRRLVASSCTMFRPARAK